MTKQTDSARNRQGTASHTGTPPQTERTYRKEGAQGHLSVSAQDTLYLSDEVFLKTPVIFF